MSDYIAEIETAARVLTAIADKENPAPADVEELLLLAPECSALPIDELVCTVFQRALKKRAAAEHRSCRHSKPH